MNWDSTYCEHGNDFRYYCSLCGNGRLRAQLAAVTKERDEARAEDRDVVYRRLLRERDALEARVAALEAALEPTAENVRALWDATWDTERCFCRPDPCEHCEALAKQAIAAIRARASIDAKEVG